MKKSSSWITCTALTGMVLWASAGLAAEIGEGFSARAAEAVKKTKATIKDKGLQLGLKEYEASAIKLRADFPERPEPWAMLLEVAINLDYQDDHLQPKRTMKGSEDQEVQFKPHSDLNLQVLLMEKFE